MLGALHVEKETDVVLLSIFLPNVSYEDHVLVLAF